MNFDLDLATEVLRRSPATLRALLEGLSEPWIRGNEGPETFSPFDVVGHLIDGEETDWIPRARIILARGPDPRFEPYDRLRHQARNAGRSATMEVIDPDIGAQVENRDLPLLGVDFDARDASIHVMMGDDKPEGRHLTRTVRGATAVQVLRTPDGHDLMLRVAHGRGQTLVTLEKKA